jgi:hypothetical protein
VFGDAQVPAGQDSHQIRRCSSPRFEIVVIIVISNRGPIIAKLLKQKGVNHNYESQLICSFTFGWPKLWGSGRIWHTRRKWTLDKVAQ